MVAPRPVALTDSPEPAAEGTPGARAGFTLAVLCVIYVLNFLDRSLLPILAKPIQDAFHITDGQLGLIGGLYFAIFYCFIAIPIGWLADKTRRVDVLAVACAIWSAATAFTGFAVRYPQLVVARMLVGVGEAGGVPPSYALITDSFPPGRRGKAFGIYNLGPPIGAALGIAFGASIAAAFNWRDAFIVLGGVGIFAAIATRLILREPPRGALDPGPASPATTPSGFYETVVMFFSRPTLVLTALAGGVTQVVLYGQNNFTALFLMREKGMTLHQIAIWYALLVGIVISAGMVVSGQLLDRLTRRSRTAYATIPAAALLLAIPFYLGFVWAPSWPLSLTFLIGPGFLNTFFLAPAIALVQEEVRPDQRSTAGALLLLFMNFMGIGLGPAFVGALSDFFHATHPAHSLQMALYVLTPFYVVAILTFLALARVLKSNSRYRA